MSDQEKSPESNHPLQPQIFLMEKPRDFAAGAPESIAPRVIATAQTGRIIPAAPVETQPAQPLLGRSRRYSLAIRLGLTGLIVAFCGWLGVDLYLWIASAFDHSAGLGWVATALVAAGVGAAGAIIAHEIRSFFALKKIEENQRRFVVPWEEIRSSDLKKMLLGVIAAIPKDQESKTAIEAFQRKVQRHHSSAQQIELFSQTVMALLDRRAEAIVRRASARAFGITAISPTAVTEALFFIACSIRMVREVAACYGHRPTTFATAHLLRRLVVEAGKLGAIDFVGATLTQHIGGAVAERVAASAAESLYATQRMARLGLVTMELCRPIPFRRHELPGILSSLIGNLLTRPAETGQYEKGSS